MDGIPEPGATPSTEVSYTSQDDQTILTLDIAKAEITLLRTRCGYGEQAGGGRESRRGDGVMAWY